MSVLSATATAFPNIAFIKYWGNRDNSLRLPSNGSISMNLAGLTSRTTVTFTPDQPTDRLIINGQSISGAGLQRASQLLDRVRRQAGLELPAVVTSENNFPTGAGIASSASGFAALAVAAARAAGLDLDEAALSRLARTASGSACRSVPGGFVEWRTGETDDDSYASSIATPGHWDLVDCVAVVSKAHKAMISQEGHALAGTSPLQPGRLVDAPRRLDICRQAILQRDFQALAEVMEQDSNLMHAVMMTSRPPILYWQPATIAVMQTVRAWRQSGLPACYTIDAGPNAHVICPSSAAATVCTQLQAIPGVHKVLTAAPGGPAQVIAP